MRSDQVVTVVGVVWSFLRKYRCIPDLRLSIIFRNTGESLMGGLPGRTTHMGRPAASAGGERSSLMSSTMMMERTGTAVPGMGYPTYGTPTVGTPTGMTTGTHWMMVPRSTFKVEKCTGGFKMTCVCDDKMACSMVQNLCTMLAGGMCSCCCMMNGMTCCSFNFM